MWQEDDVKMNHHYYQKPMKRKMVIMKKSAMAKTQKISILSNEAVQRLSNVNHNRIEMKEIVEVMEDYTEELKNSGYDQSGSREIVTSGVVEWKRKRWRRRNVPKCSLNPVRQMQEKALGKCHMVQKEKERGRRRRRR